MDFLKLTSEKLDPTEISDLVVHEGCGAVAMFAGTTRDNFDGKQVVTLEYEAYDEMAKKEMANICFEIRQRWPDIKHIAMYHRLGLVAVKEASVVIAISSPHRKSSLEALPFALDELKKSVPVWKKEFYKVDTDKKKIKFSLEDCRLVDELALPETMIQITVDESEMQRRIQAFIEQKREEINENNLLDFLEKENEDSCARIASNVYRIKDSKGHLKIKRVKNETGPYEESFTVKNQLGNYEKTNFNVCSSINERLQDAEEFLKVQSGAIPKSIYQRLKAVEEQISHLQTVSPEYSQFVVRRNLAKKMKQVYSVSDLDKIIQNMENKH